MLKNSYLQTNKDSLFVWTMFVFFYFLIGVIGFFLSSYGISKWILDDYSPLIWAFSLLIILTAYFAGKYGEQLGADQIEILKQFVRDAIDAKKDS
ncbi:MAG: hypothetical protein AAGJ93_04760 [Bacteroidota bacterium]